MAEGVQVDAEALAVLASRAAGSMRDSQSLLEQLLAVSGERVTADDVYNLLGIAPAERLRQLVEAVVNRQAAAALAQLSEAVAGGADVGQLVDQLLGYFRDIMATVVGCDASQLLYVLRSQHDHAQALGEKLGIQTVLAMIQILDQTAARMRVSVHTRTLAEMALVRLCHLDDLDDLATAIADVRAGTASDVPAESVKKNGSPSPVAPMQSAPPTPVASPSPPPTATPAPASRIDAPEQPAYDPAEALPTEVTSIPSSIDPARLTAAWNAAVAGLEGLVGVQAELASKITLSGDGTAHVFFAPQNLVSKEFCESPSTSETLHKAVAQELGQRVVLRFVVDDLQSSGTGKPTPAPAPRISRRQLQAEIAQRPFVARALELFDSDSSKLKIIPPKNS